ncbi:hypothetical protein FH609_015665 [Streptomyces sp. 3MP-14]|uniref:Uncharacterized protein n=1 Tax=Streptomyces mimosae TaxID=2586635 RepID=A0A5N6ADP4_9ACTN|nr:MULTISPECIES: hypothetical protein [Streptomyces]KAB8165920.1 hypothetical protein FH607_012990 [Streptomyces mimosae]KAB8176309.1 hypothetical protein FH609_015665 [Streptomyces sp. 3MP-14]
MDDIEFGRLLLANVPLHAGREPGELRRWADAAWEFGVELAAEHPGAGADGWRGEAVVVERDGGLAEDRLLLARYRSRPVETVELFTDTLALAEETVELLGWRHWFPPGSPRRAALVHEEGHRLLGDRRRRAELRRRLNHPVLRLGRRRVLGHVAGADELAAHAFAHAVCGLGRSPLLLTAALTHAVRSRES